MEQIKPTCRIDGQECDFHIKYMPVFGQKFMLRLSECRLTNSKGYYPTHIDHCDEQIKGD